MSEFEVAQIHFEKSTVARIHCETFIGTQIHCQHHEATSQEPMAWAYYPKQHRHPGNAVSQGLSCGHAKTWVDDHSKLRDSSPDFQPQPLNIPSRHTHFLSRQWWFLLRHSSHEWRVLSEWYIPVSQVVAVHAGSEAV